MILQLPRVRLGGGAWRGLQVGRGWPGGAGAERDNGGGEKQNYGGGGGYRRPLPCGFGACAGVRRPGGLGRARVGGSMARGDASRYDRHRHRGDRGRHGRLHDAHWTDQRSEEHTSELQSLMRISYAVFCLKKKKEIIEPTH